MKTYYIVPVMIICVLSIIGIAQQDTDPLKVIIKSKPLGYEKDSGKQIALVNITTNKIGHFTYTEKYYIANNTGHLIFSSETTYYNNILKNNEESFQITRPVVYTEKPYPFIKSVVTVENQTASAWIRTSKITDDSVGKNSTISSSIVPIKTSINTTYIGLNKSWFMSDYIVNITTRPGHLRYVEEYFTVDSSSDPKIAMANTHYDGNITDNNISFQMLRPLSRSGKAYSMIRGAIILDGKRIYEKWLRIVSGAHLTYTIGNKANKEDQTIINNKKINENIEKFEIQDRNLRTGIPVTYKFITPDLVIYDVNVTGTGNDSYVALIVKLLKDVPISTKRFPWTVYKYLDISLDTHQIRKIDLRYKVENSWIKNSNISEKDITLFRWNGTDNKWYGLKTNITGKDNNYTYYESKTTGLSSFVIAELRKSKINNKETVNNKTIDNNVSIMSASRDLAMMEDTDATIKTKKSPGFDLILLIAAILLSLYIFRKR